MSQILLNPLVLKIIATFMKRENTRIHGRELARMLGANQKTVHRHLVLMEREGVLLKSASGRNLLYEMDLENILVGYLARAAECQASVSFLSRDIEIASIMKEMMSVIPDPIIVFGSYAKDCADENSDIDILVLADEMPDIDSIRDKYVKQVHMISLAPSRFEGMVETGEPFSREVLHDHITVRGIDHMVRMWWKRHGQT
ncbi:MAG: nucleotidyltransferase domain-containing protein [Methanopyri archaeon]|nr:nucleotidyltransferase domain-containing protein [Methanopyri archaeon]